MRQSDYVDLEMQKLVTASLKKFQFELSLGSG